LTWPQYQPPPTSGAATASLILGICGLVVCPLVCSVLAIVYGKRAQREIAASQGRMGGESYASAGIITGWVGLGLCALGIVFFVFVLVLFAAGASTS
jgi:Domain of unknown function (DUF4190)